jgi:polysaccharide pyruvyl transferase CsaB
VSHLLVCGAAGYTNLGDDAILWGMLTQLREAMGARAIRVAGGPNLGPLVQSFDASAVGYDDRPELARAIEEADLIVLGGGGLLYDAGYETTLARMFGDQPDRQWLYEMARVAAAGSAAGPPVMMYSVGAGPLLTGAGRRVARFIASQSKVVTVRDRASADLLCECGVPRTRVHVAADPALLVEGATEETVLGQIDALKASRPWIALNLRPWGEPPAAERLTTGAAEFARRVRDQLGGTVILLPFQRSPDDDRPPLEAVERGSGQASVLIDSISAPSDMVAALSQVDVVVGMRLHALVLALCAGTPFVALSYDEKVTEFAHAAGLEAYVHPAGAFEPAEVIASCEALLRDRAEVAAELSTCREELRKAAGLPAELARGLVEGGRFEVRARLPADLRTRPATGIRVSMQMRPDYLERPGGDSIQMMQTKRHLTGLGVAVEVTTEESPDLASCDLVHVFNLGRPEDPHRQCLNAAQQGKPVVLSTIYWDFSEFWQCGDPDYWELPPPGEGLPRPRPAPPPDAMEARRRAHLDRLRRATIDMATVYLPNGQGEADLLADIYGMDESRSVLVTNAVDDSFFEANAEAFVEEFGLRDFVLCAARVEKRKNQLLLAAALRGTGLPLVIVGQPNPEGYRQLCRQYGGDSVTFIDALPPKELAGAYAAARVHALPGWFETPGLSTLEAAAAGCNVVTTDRGTAREYLGDGAWYCDPGSVESIREAVLAACEAPRSERLRNRIREHYTWMRAAEQTLDGYRLAVALNESTPESERRASAVRSIREQADLLARLAADRAYEARRMREWGETVEKELMALQAEFGRVTSRRLYPAALARAGWAVLRAMGVRR